MGLQLDEYAIVAISLSFKKCQKPTSKNARQPRNMTQVSRYTRLLGFGRLHYFRYECYREGYLN
jgi:hypothetical protein